MGGNTWEVEFKQHNLRCEGLRFRLLADDGAERLWGCTGNTFSTLGDNRETQPWGGRRSKRGSWTQAGLQTGWMNWTKVQFLVKESGITLTVAPGIFQMATATSSAKQRPLKRPKRQCWMLPAIKATARPSCPGCSVGNPWSGRWSSTSSPSWAAGSVRRRFTRSCGTRPSIIWPDAPSSTTSSTWRTRSVRLSTVSTAGIYLFVLGFNYEDCRIMKAEQETARRQIQFICSAAVILICFFHSGVWQSVNCAYRLMIGLEDWRQSHICLYFH